MYINDVSYIYVEELKGLSSYLLKKKKNNNNNKNVLLHCISTRLRSSHLGWQQCLGVNNLLVGLNFVLLVHNMLSFLYNLIVIYRSITDCLKLLNSTE